MFVSPIPQHGDIVVGRDVPGRVLRIAAHPGSDRVVLSIWQEGRCLATVRLAEADVPDVICALAGTLVARDGTAEAGAHDAAVRTA